jgi:hypothetical protein
MVCVLLVLAVVAYFVLLPRWRRKRIGDLLNNVPGAAPLGGAMLTQAAKSLVPQVADALVAAVSDRLMEQQGSVLAKTPSQLVSELGASSTASLGLKPGPKTPLAVSTHAYELLTKAGVGGQGMQAEYAKLRDALRQEFSSLVPGPVYSGPAPQGKQLLTAALHALVADPGSALMAPLIQQAATAGMESPSALTAFLQQELGRPLALLQVFKQACTTMGGSLAANNACWWPSARACNSHSAWPLGKREGTNGAHLEWQEASKSCVLAPGAMRQLCKAAGLEYNALSGSCTVTQQACTEKGGTWGARGMAATA